MVKKKLAFLGHETGALIPVVGRLAFELGLELFLAPLAVKWAILL
jgi:hypothetical protein